MSVLQLWNPNNSPEMGYSEKLYPITGDWFDTIRDVMKDLIRGSSGMVKCPKTLKKGLTVLSRVFCIQV
jgi:hypothetical protein